MERKGGEGGRRRRRKERGVECGDVIADALAVRLNQYWSDLKQEVHEMTESDDVTIEDDEILPDDLWVLCLCDIILEYC